MTSEKSKLSGMRIIISPEVFNDLNAQKVINKPIEAFGLDISENDVSMPYYFRHISTNDTSNKTDLYELIWSFNGMNSCTDTYITNLEKLKATFDSNSLRHFKATADVLLAGLLLSDCTNGTKSNFEHRRKRLELLKDTSSV